MTLGEPFKVFSAIALGLAIASSSAITTSAEAGPRSVRDHRQPCVGHYSCARQEPIGGTQINGRGKQGQVMRPRDRPAGGATVRDHRGGGPKWNPSGRK